MGTEIRDLQLEMLSMMKKVDSLFKENNIHYVLLGGTILGAIRHKGFIPWDDDVDIGILRKDFEKAEKLLSGMDKYTYEFAEKHIIPDGPCAHLHYVNSKYPLEYSPTLDFFPIDKVPSLQYPKQRKKFMFWANVHHLSVLRRPPYNRGKAKKILIGISLKFMPSKFLDFLQKKTLDKVLNMQIKGDNWLGNIWQGEKEFFPEEVYLRTIEVPFEDTVFPIPELWEQYLTSLYGNYMELPPESERVPKHHKN